MKNLRLKLVSELMKNSRRSDRELAKAVGTSGLAVNRLIKKLRSEGYIKEYTMIPDFGKIGYKIMALTFVKVRKGVNSDAEKANRAAKETLEKGLQEIVMLERGIGLDSNCVIVSYHKDYKSYEKLKEQLCQSIFLQANGVQSYLIDLDDALRYRPLTFSTLANSMLNAEKEPLISDS